MKQHPHTGRNGETTKIYGVIKGAHYIPDKLQEKALHYINLIVREPNIRFCDVYELKECFSWSETAKIGAGGYKFWNEVNDYLERLKER